MSYPEAIRYLESFVNYEKIPAYPYKESLKLERLRDFLSVIGNPQDSLKCIHIAGTKGKGSTSAFIAYILREAGFKTGLYTSPHLADFRERIRILKPGNNGCRKRDFEGMISKKELAALIYKLKPAVDKFNRRSCCGALSFFEVYTALSFVYFDEQEVDFAVLETGLGGRLDATNVVAPLVCAITPISYEHTQKLGRTLKKIAGEKAGIIKEHQSTRAPCLAGRQAGTSKQGTRVPVHQLVVISASQEREASEVIRRQCKKTGAVLYEVGKQIKYYGGKGIFSVKGIFAAYPELKIKLLGQHQLINAAVALGAVEALRHYGINIDYAAIKNGLYHTLWPARCEIISRNPLVVLDGAQNRASAGVLRKAIKDNFKYKRLILVLGVSDDKDKKGITAELYDLADEIILTRADNPRATAPEDLQKYFLGRKTYLTGNIKEAKSLAVRIAGREDLILVCGSLFVAGEYRNDKTRSY